MKTLKIISTFLFVTAVVLYCTGCGARGGETIATVVTEAPTEAPAETADPGEAAKAVAAALGRPEFADFWVEDIYDATLDTSASLTGRWTPGDTEAMWAAIQADCEAGLLSQDEANHSGQFHFADGSTTMFGGGAHDAPYVLFTLWGGDKAHSTAYLFQIFPDSENTVKVLESRGLLEEYGITVK